MKKRIGSILVTALGLLLLIYSATRSLDFISLTLPADKQILAFFGLAALDGGLIFWLLNFQNGARGWQRPIALLMVFIDFVGCVAMFTMDTFYNTGQAGLTAALSAGEIKIAIIALSAVIALNVGAVVMHHIMDPDSLRQMAEEEARDKIEDLALKEVSANAGKLAAELAPQIGMAWMDQERANYQNVMQGRKRKATSSLPAMVTVKAAEIEMPEISEALSEKEEVLPEKTNPTKPARSRSQKAS